MKSELNRKSAIFVALCFLLSLAAGRAQAESLTFAGADGASWDLATNWSPEKIPTADDDVTIEGKWVQTPGSIAAKSILIQKDSSGTLGSLTVAGTANDVSAQTKVADLTGTVRVDVGGDIVLNGGKFSVGAQGAPYNIAVSIGGDLVVTNGSHASFHSGETADIDALDATGTIAKLFANANYVTVGGTFLVGKGSTVYHESNQLSGTPVIFKVKNFTQEAGAVNTSVNRGWAKVLNPSTVPVRSIREDVDGSKLYSYALGQGWSYGYGAGYGANSGSVTTKSVTYVNADGTTKSVSFSFGYSYGYAFAPFLPGSPNGVYRIESSGIPSCTRGGGAICIWASDTITLAGSTTVKGLNDVGIYGAPSAGSIWFAAKRFAVARTASLDAEGGKCNGGYGSSGGAGRISLAVGLTEAQLGSLAANATPESLSLRSADASGFTCNVLGGYGAGGAWRSGSGTSNLVWTTGSIPFEVAGTPSEYSTATPAYGWHALPVAEVPSSFTTAVSSIYPEYYRNLRRYANGGVIVTDEDTVVPLADIAKTTGRVKVTHQWTTIEDCVRLRIVGGGSVQIGEDTHTADTEFWKVAGSTIGATATAGSGSFVRWVGDITNGVTTAATVRNAVLPGQTLWAVFSDAGAVAKSYTGASGGFWDVADNWTPAGVPTPVDDVTISSTFVKSYGMTAAGSLTLSGAQLAIGGMNKPAVTVIGDESEKYYNLSNQSKPTDCAMSGSGMFVGGDLSLTGASEMTLGAYRQEMPYWCLQTGGNFSLEGSSKVTVYAKAYDGVVNSSLKIDLTNHYHTATTVFVGGNLTLAGSSRALVESEAVTGAPVKWRVAGDVTVGASAGFDAAARGYEWTDYSATGSIDPRYTRSWSVYYTLGPGYGHDYTIGGSYGGAYSSSSCGGAYGFDVAPYLAGSPSGAYSNQARGGGAVWVHCDGAFELNGTIYANGGIPRSTGSGGSGGSIWIAAAKYRAGSGAALKARGGRNYNGGGWAGGCGGRICLAEGVSAEQLDVLATGERPEELTYSASIAGTTVSVAGGFCSKDNSTGVSTYGPAGTIVKISGEVSEFPLEVYSTPVKCQAENLDYAAKTVEKGKTWSWTIGEYGYDPANAANVRYACASWVISNAVGEVARGTGSTASFTPEQGPFTLTWTWNDRHVRHLVNVPEHATITLNGTPYAESTSVWLANAEPVTMSVTPEEGYEFLCWEGPVAFGKANSTTLELSAGNPYDVTPVVRAQAEATTRTWLGGSAVWHNAAKWNPAGIPGTNDTLLVGSGTCWVSNYLACGSLTLSGSAALKVAEKALSGLEEAALVVQGDLVMSNSASLVVAPRNYYRHGRLAVGGDLQLLGANSLTVSGGPTNHTTFTCAKGAGWVTVGGDFVVDGTSKVTPNSEYWTGGSVVFSVGGDFVLGAKAAFRANAVGYQRVDGRSPVTLAPGAGYDYTKGAGYGGYGVGHDGTYGRTYGFEYAPVHPGSTSGHYGGGHAGGGLVRIHARGNVSLAGEINVNAEASDTASSSASGGGIWVTAGGRLDVADGAILKARGGYRCTGVGAAGGGGRIALGQRLSAAYVESLAQTGKVSAWSKMAKHEITTAFLAEHPNVTIDLLGGEGYGGIYQGTFRFLDGTNVGLMLILK